MLIFENEKFLTSIKKEGISANDINARFKLQYLLCDLIQNSTYKKGKIIEIVKNIANDYFAGLPENIIENQLINMYAACENKHYTFNDKQICLYESEMKTIAELKDDKLMRLAFAALIVHKFNGQYSDNGIIKCYGAVKEADADIYRIAGLDKISGQKKLKLWNALSEKDLVKFFVKTNPTFKFNPSWISITMFMVKFNEDIKQNDNKKIYMKIYNYDDILDYLYAYLRPINYKNCVDCGRPIPRTEKAKVLCSNCAVQRKKDSDKRRYMSLQTA